MDHVARAEEYYTLVSEKNREGIGSFLDPEVEFSGPLAVLKGRDAVIEATGNFMNAFNSLTIRAKLGSENLAMIVYDVDIPGIAKKFPGASLMTFRGGLIVKIELFYDGGKMVQKKAEIFS